MPPDPHGSLKRQPRQHHPSTINTFILNLRFSSYQSSNPIPVTVSIRLLANQQPVDPHANSSDALHARNGTVVRPKNDLTDEIAKIALPPGEHFERHVGEPRGDAQRRAPSLVPVPPWGCRRAHCGEPGAWSYAGKSAWWERGGERRCWRHVVIIIFICGGVGVEIVGASC